MRARRATWALVAASVLALGFGPASAQERPKTSPKKSATEEVVARAYRRAARADDEKLVRVTMAPNDERLVLIAEYESGDIGLFIPSDEAENDAFGIVSAKNVDLIRECMDRAHRAAAPR